MQLKSAPKAKVNNHNETQNFSVENPQDESKKPRDY